MVMVMVMILLLLELVGWHLLSGLWRAVPALVDRGHPRRVHHRAVVVVVLQLEEQSLLGSGRLPAAVRGWSRVLLLLVCSRCGYGLRRVLPDRWWMRCLARPHPHQPWWLRPLLGQGKTTAAELRCHSWFCATYLIK